MDKKKKKTNSVRVAVRLRPFNTKEKKNGEDLCIEMVEGTTRINDPQSSREYAFTYDYSFWSFEKDDPGFASQEMVYKELGRQVIDDSIRGYNTCIFAYGQTGSGKSYTQYGSKEKPGIIPRLCNGLFERIDELTKSKESNVIKVRVEVSMIEIYNEKVRDLFNPTNKKNDVGLTVRENPKTGPYVDGLTKNIAQNYQELKTLLDEGSKVRTIRATSMNDRSSRAHTIFQLAVTQFFQWSKTKKKKFASVSSKKKKKKGIRKSVINLIDLAGSERQSKAKTSGQRLKEGSSINLSLSMLGNVINQLADNAEKSTKGGSGGGGMKFVTYRNSKLTWLLKDSLGGNSKTIMIATLSPAASNFPETLSTLRYADRAKAIKNHAVVNEDPQSKLINELRAEIERLKKLLQGGVGGLANEEGGVQSAEKRRLMEQLKESQRIIAQLQMSEEEMVNQTKNIGEQRRRALEEAGVSSAHNRRVVPHIINLNEDATLSENLLYFFKPDDYTRIGRVKIINKFQKNDVVLSSAASKEDEKEDDDEQEEEEEKEKKDKVDHDAEDCKIEIEHCIVENVRNKKVYLMPCAGARCYLNGELVKSERVELHTYDRLILGNKHIFRFHNPNEKLDEGKLAQQKRMNEVIDWEFVKKEMENKLREEMQRKRMEEEKLLDEEFSEKRREEEEKIQNLVSKRKRLQASIRLIHEENERKRKEEEERLREITRLEKDVQGFESKLGEEKKHKLKLENERLENNKKVEHLRSSISVLEKQLLSNKKETDLLCKEHDLEKRELERQSKDLMMQMENLKKKLSSVEKEKELKEEEQKRQKEKLGNLKNDVSDLQSRLKEEIMKKEKLKEESLILAQSEKQWKEKHKMTSDLLRGKIEEQKELLPVLEKMIFARDSNNRKQIQLLQDQLSKQQLELNKLQLEYAATIEKLEAEKNQKKTDFVDQLLKQITQLVEQREKLMKNTLMEKNVDVQKLQGILLKYEEEKKELADINGNLKELANERLNIIMGLHSSIDALNKKYNVDV